MRCELFSAYTRVGAIRYLYSSMLLQRIKNLRKGTLGHFLNELIFWKNSYLMIVYIFHLESLFLKLTGFLKMTILKPEQFFFSNFPNMYLFFRTFTY
jgi:hypothetical protein